MKNLLLIGLLIISFGVKAQYNPEKMLFSARVMLSQKNAQDAMPILNRLISVYPENADAYYLRGLAKYFQNDFLGAEKDYTEALKIKPYYPEAQHYRGISRDMMLNFKGAIKDFEKTLELRPDDPDILTDFSISLLHDGQADKANEMAKRANKLQRGNLRTLLCLGAINTELENYSEAIEYFTLVLNMNPTFSQAKINRGRAYLLKDSIDLALQDFTEVLLAEPENAFARLMRAQSHHEAFEYQLALADLDTLLVFAPENSNALYRKALLQADMNKKQLALETLNKLVALNPDNFLAYYTRGTILFELGKSSAALNDYNTMLNLYPTFADGWYNKSVMLYRVGRVKEGKLAEQKAYELKQISEAGVEYEKDKFAKLAPFNNDFNSANINKGIGVEPISPKIMGLILDKNGGSKLASDLFVRNFSSEIGLKINLETLSYFFENTPDEVYKKMNELSAEIAVGNKSLLNYFIRGTLYAQTGSLSQAVEDLKKALQINPDHLPSKFNLAVIELERLSIKSSFDELNKYIVNNEENPYFYGGNNDEMYQAELLSILSEFNEILNKERNFSHAIYNRAIVKTLLKDYNGSINDYEICLLYNPNFSAAYLNVGLIYFFFENQEIACEKFSKAGELGLNEAYRVITRFCNKR